jgi:hypothetical protein
MAKQKFGRSYDTFQDWLQKQQKTTSYTKRIIRLHDLYPDATLDQLRGHAAKEQKKLSELKPSGSPVHLVAMTPKEKGLHDKGIAILHLMRRENISLDYACKIARIEPNTILPYLKPALQLEHGSYFARPNDNLQREMHFFTEEGAAIIICKSSKDASRYASYLNAVKDYLATGNDKSLNTFRNKYVTDYAGRKYKLITNKKLLIRLYEAGELPQEESIYVA